MSTEGADSDSGNDESATHSCPWDGCEYSTQSKRGLKVHHKKRHGESIVPVTVCGFCDKQFRSTPAKRRKFCSRECSARSQEKRVEIKCGYCEEPFTTRPFENRTFCSRECMGNASRNSVEIECGQCGQLFETWPSKEQSYCSPQCASEAQKSRQITRCLCCGDYYTISPSRLNEATFCSQKCKGLWQSQNHNGENNPNWTAKIEVDCNWCGEGLLRNPSRVLGHERHFCSQNHLGKWRKANIPTGQDHHLWRGGQSTYDAVLKNLSSKSWNSVRKSVLERDKHTCQMCGEQQKPLHVHHLVPVLSGGTNAKKLLMTLCRSCHTSTENKTRDLIDPVLCQ